jgi:hypothetical protein
MSYSFKYKHRRQLTNNIGGGDLSLVVRTSIYKAVNLDMEDSFKRRFFVVFCLYTTQTIV